MDVVQKTGSFFCLLNHKGIDYGDYIATLTYLSFLSLAEENRLSLPDHFSLFLPDMTNNQV